MKPFEELTHEELVALTHEELNFHVDRECAERGVPLVPPSAPIEPKNDVTPDVTLFAVAGLLFVDESEAREVADFIDLRTRMSSHYQGYNYMRPQVVRPDFSTTPVVRQEHFSEDHAAKTGDRKAAYDKAKAAYDKERQEYDKAIAGRNQVYESLSATVEKAHQLERRRVRLRDEFERYLKLADGDRTIALRFLTKAYAASDVDDAIPVEEGVPF